jgi:hypothetical protein
VSVEHRIRCKTTQNGIGGDKHDGNVAQESRGMHSVGLGRPPITVVLAIAYLTVLFGAIVRYVFLRP